MRPHPAPTASAAPRNGAWPAWGIDHATRIRRQCRGSRHRAGRHQAVAAARQPQARHAQHRQFARARPGGRASARPSSSARAAGSPRSNACARKLRSSSCACAEPNASSARNPSSVPRKSFASAVAEIAEQLRADAVRPVLADDEARRGRDHDQAAHGVRMIAAPRAARTARPATSPATPRRGTRADQFVGERFRHQWRGVCARVTVAGQVDQVQRVAIGQAIDQRREQAAVHRPAVNECQRGAVAARR